MAYIPPHKRQLKDSERPSPIPERLVPQFSRQLNLKSSSNANHNLNRILCANERIAISRWYMYIVGLDADNQFPSSVHLVPTSIESFKQRMFENPLVLVNSHPAIKEIDEEGVAISGTPLDTKSSTPWESVAVDVWPKLLSAFEIVRDMLESNDELDEVKPAIFARFGKILFHPSGGEGWAEMALREGMFWGSAFYAYKVGVFIVMAYIPPHKRHSKDPERPSPIPERLVPQFSRQVNLKSSSNANARKASSRRSMYVVGLDADNQFPSSLHLVPTFIESFRHRFVVKPLVLVNSYPATKDETILGTPSETISSTPWESVAVDVWPKLLSAFKIVNDLFESDDELDEVKPAMLESDDELDEVKPTMLESNDEFDEVKPAMSESDDEFDEVKLAIVARFGKILFHPNSSVRSLIKDRVAETTLRQMNTTFYANTPSSYMENIISGVAPKIGFDREEDKDIFYILLSDSTRPTNSTIYCKCRIKEDKKLELYKVEMNPVRMMFEDILCIDKNLDLRLALHIQKILTSLTDDEMHSIQNIINSAIIDPKVKGGLRWPYGKACSGDRFAVVKIWHTIAKKCKSSSLSLMARHVDRFDFKNAYGQASIEVYLKLKRLVSDLQDEKAEMDLIFEMFKDNLKMIWDHFLCYLQIQIHGGETSISGEMKLAGDLRSTAQLLHAIERWSTLLRAGADRPTEQIAPSRAHINDADHFVDDERLLV
ncbi:hypothetical protein EZV62_007514 [Acer yangbiense]|uniref:DUF7903 domain-containing protein n=1 Tax=Acer yangbiense TaxID=1000413 RepID=A0A5C7IBT2_9ROSI|nr:hypothetical protein EZV62_007514 [Acer yangbiense]